MKFSGLFTVLFMGSMCAMPVMADGLSAPLGAVAGGLVGSMFGQGNGRLAASAAGAVLGYATGEAIQNQPYGQYNQPYGQPYQGYGYAPPQPPQPPQPVYAPVPGYAPGYGQPAYNAGYYNGPPQVIYQSSAYYGGNGGWRGREGRGDDHRDWRRYHGGDDD